MDISVSAKADVDVKAMLSASVALKAEVDAFVSASAGLNATAAADLVLGLSSGTPVTVSTFDTAFTEVYAQLLAVRPCHVAPSLGCLTLAVNPQDVYAAAKLVGSANVSVQAAVSADIQACVCVYAPVQKSRIACITMGANVPMRFQNRSTVNSITASLEAVIGPIYADLGASLTWVDSLCISLAHCLGISVSASVYAVASVRAALVALVKATVSSCFIVVSGVQICIGLVI